MTDVDASTGIERALPRALHGATTTLRRAHARRGVGEPNAVAADSSTRSSDASRWAKLRHFRRAHPFGVAIAASSASVFAIVFTRWFSTGLFYATGDVTPWERAGLRAELGWSWTHQLSGAGGPSYEIARLPEVAFNVIAHVLGGTDTLGQRLLFAAMWAFAAGAGSALVAAFTRRPWIAYLAGVLAAFNTFFLLYLPNYLPVVTFGILALLTTTAVRAARGEGQRWIVAALATTPLCYVSLNPPLVAVTLAWIAVLPLIAAALTGTGLRGIGRSAAMLLRAAVLALPLALWWIVPMVIALVRSAGTGTGGAVTDVVAWSWTHRNNSIANVLTLRSEWTWPLRQYHGTFVRVLSGPALSWTAWILPVGAIASPVAARRDRRRAAIAIVGTLPVLVLLGKGLHPPLRSLSLYLYRHVPGLWLLREPMSKLAPIFLVGYILAFALSVEGAVERVRTARRLRWRRVALGAVVLSAVGPLAFAFPMLTGAATNDAQPGRVSRVAIPADWERVAAAVNQSPLRGKALVLPLGDFYQLPTTWGYYGADNLVRQLLTRPVISRNPQGYITDAAVFDAMVRTAESALANGDETGALTLLEALGVSHVIVRKDIDLHSSQRSPIDVLPYDRVVAGLQRISALHSTLDNSMAHVFELDDPRAQQVQLFGGVLDTGKIGATALLPLLMGTPKGLALAEHGYELSVGSAWSPSPGFTQEVFRAAKAGDYVVNRRILGVPLFRVSVDRRLGPIATALVFQDVVRYDLNGQPIAARPDIRVSVPEGEPIAFDVNGSLVDLQQDEYLPIDTVTRVTPLVASAVPGLGAFGPVGDCHRYDSRTASQTGLGARAVVDGSGPVYELTAKAHSACIFAPLPGAAGGVVYRVAFQSRSLQGASARACLLVAPSNTCVALQDSPPSGGWRDVDDLVRLPAGTTSAQLYFYADEPVSGHGRTTTRYRKVQVDRLESSATVTLRPDPPSAQARALPAAPALLRSQVDVPSPVLSTWSGVQDCNRFDNRTVAQAGLRAVPTTATGSTSDAVDADVTGVTLSARVHSACVSASIDGVRPLVPYEVHFDYRTADGSPPRACVLDSATGSCVTLTPTASTPAALPADHTWRTASYDFTMPFSSNPMLSPPSLYVYADGSAQGTKVAYRQVAVRPVVDEDVTVMTSGRTVSRPPAMTWSQDGPARYHVSVTAARRPFVLALADSWSPDWHVDGLPMGAHVRHVRIDGYRNGWVVEATGDLHLTISYAPARWGREALALSVGTACAIACGLARRTVRRRRRAARGRAGSQTPRSA